MSAALTANLSQPKVESSILQLKGITKRYSGNLAAAVREVSFQLQQGDILGLLGPSGCGKTTLLRLIAGFEQAEAGCVWLNGQIIADQHRWTSPEQRRIGMVFQDFALFPHLTVANNVTFGLQQIRRLSLSQKRQRQTEVLSLVGLLGMEDRYPHELSGGQQQRVALARALAPQPQLILLDEPLSNLDVQVRLRLRQELRDILKTAGTTALFVTHDQEEALAIADQVAVMRNGGFEQIGTPEEIYQQPRSQFVAEFVTQANFLAAHRQGDTWQTEVGCFAATPTTGDVSFAGCTQAVVMIRQEDLLLHPDGDAAIVIRDRQFLGREYRYCLKTQSGQELHARSASLRPLPVGTTVNLSVIPENLKIFPQNSALPAQKAA
ncbi:MAG: ABC transporter ATP-binding protein [Acaryochloris sp. RU_4_1]|nr:ABC transporter ATP-binding protein [Acaryochloris sp. RU_4_1]NJN37734.1 ABC transporter ATP-binding protein [Acaryochloridaceae cyanobacterium CSU_3_4]NJR54563.1 ABC transporter ATP-binding protein [Acaryochloris sp. CRU_2_0]